MITMRYIQGPNKNTLELLRHRMTPDGKKTVEGVRPGAIGLFEAKLPDLYYYADVAVKECRVDAVEILGTCPAHASTIALYGDTEAVKQALRKIRQMDAGGGKIEI